MKEVSILRDLFDLSGKVACVTGASAGLGRRAAIALASAGASVVGVARRRDTLLSLEQQIGPAFSFVDHDVSIQGRLKELAQHVAGPFGSPDILVHAAGINTRQTADAVTPQGWNVTLDLNLRAPFFLSQFLVNSMREKGWGRIINFASLQSFRAFPGGLAYGVSKGGVAQLTRAMAEAWSCDGVNVNAIAPGFFKTELTAPVFADPALAARNADQTCIGRNGEPDDIDGAVLFLASNASSYVTGQILNVDGGFTAK